MEIQHEHKTEGGAFYIEENGKRVAEMVYRMHGPHAMVIEHTEVSPTLGGKGIGKQLINQAVAFARENHFKIVPVCSFVKAFFQKNTGYEDVV